MEFVSREHEQFYNSHRSIDIKKEVLTHWFIHSVFMQFAGNTFLAFTIINIIASIQMLYMQIGRQCQAGVLHDLHITCIH